MIYIYRNIEATINKAAKMFSTVLITGARPLCAGKNQGGNCRNWMHYLFL